MYINKLNHTLVLSFSDLFQSPLPPSWLHSPSSPCNVACVLTGEQRGGEGDVRACEFKSLRVCCQVSERGEESGRGAERGEREEGVVGEGAIREQITP